MELETKDKGNRRVAIVVLAILIILSVILNCFQYYQVNEIENKYEKLRTVYSIELKADEGYDKQQQIYEYYTLAAEDYDLSDYDGVIYNCEKSRDISQEYSQDLRDLKVEIKNTGLDIASLRARIIEKKISFLFALYESCEYLESASRAYSKGDYQSGNNNVEMQAESIKRHDRLLEEYYNLISEYSYELERIVE